MVKLCPYCASKPAIVKYTTGSYSYLISQSEIAFSKRYFCGGCLQRYSFCIICRITLNSLIWGQHHLECHSVYNDANKFIRIDATSDTHSIDHFREYNSDGTRNFVNRAGMTQSYSSNPQLYSLNLLRIASYYSSFITSMSSDEFHKLLNYHLFSNDYECKLCGNVYDSFPTVKIVRMHFRKCMGAKQINKK